MNVERLTWPLVGREKELADASRRMLERPGGGGFPFPGATSGVFKPGKASAQVTASVCSPFPFPGPCSTMSTDAIIRLTK